LTIDPRLHRIVAAQPYPLLFATISGAHLYGFPPPDSDFDLRGAHVLPLENVVGLEVREETVERQMRVAPHPGPLPQETSNSPRPSPGLRPPPPAPAGEGQGGGGEELEMDIVSHDVRKFFRLLLKKNGYVPEQLFSPLIVHPTPEHEESVLDDADVALHESEYERLRAELQSAHETSRLPELPSEETRAALNDLLVRLRRTTNKLRR
jgi:hypothetical protein